MLAVQLNYDGRAYDTPAGQTNWEEPARCTAEAATLQETGYTVEAGELLDVVRNGFQIYNCTLLSAVPRRAPDGQASWVGWLDKQQLEDLLEDDQWRFHEAYHFLRWLTRR